MLHSSKLGGRIHVRENELHALAERARHDSAKVGYLAKKSVNSNTWKTKFFILYQNVLFYYEDNTAERLLGAFFLEGSYCNRVTNATPTNLREKPVDDYFLQNSLEICFRNNSGVSPERHFVLKAGSELECNEWISAINDASYTKLRMSKEELEHKHTHLLQILETERTSKWGYIQQCEELGQEVKKLRAELIAVKRESECYGTSTTDPGIHERFDADASELRKIKKVQSFFRGWLCRRRWKQIVEQYIKSPHAENMRKRNKLIFKMVEAEEEYLDHIEVLVTCFMRPLKMAASSRKPPCTHEEVNSIFLNTETVLFLHQIFLKGLTTRMESWPSLVLGDLFSMLLPMLSIYLEYVRNHHFSLQTVAECKQTPAFQVLLKRLESKSQCHGRSLEALLTHPMHQIPKYIIALHEILAHTPHDHVERKSLTNAKQKLEDLSRLMHDEVSETENLRTNLAVERMIVEGCDIILDVNQVFVRMGNLVQLPQAETTKCSKSRIAFKKDKEMLRHCFLFSNHLIITTRSTNGKLHLVPNIGKIPLEDTILIEDPSEEDDGLCCTSKFDLQNRDFKLIVDFSANKLKPEQVHIHLLAPTIKDKAAWASDISQCIENLQLSDMLKPPLPEHCPVSLPHSIKNDPKLFKDDADIRFNRTLNSCKVPQIRYATPERLLQRLTDLRFLSIDFLNTFLLTYRVFTDSITVLNALRKVYYTTDYQQLGSLLSFDGIKGDATVTTDEEQTKSCLSLTRRTSAASSVSGYGSEMSSEQDRSHSYDSQGHRQWKSTLEKYEEESQEAARKKSDDDDESGLPCFTAVSIEIHRSDDISVIKVPGSNSSETLTDATVIAAPCLPSNLSSVTLIPTDFPDEEAVAASAVDATNNEAKPLTVDVATIPDDEVNIEESQDKIKDQGDEGLEALEDVVDSVLQSPPISYSQRTSCASRCLSLTTSTVMQSYYGIRRSIQEGDTSGRSSFQLESPQKRSKPGVIITSARDAKRRSSNSSTATAFAVATSASSNPRDASPSRDVDEAAKSKYKESLISTACTMRVLNVLRHWISKHYQDFENDTILKTTTIEFLDDILTSPNLLQVEYKAALQLLRLLNDEAPRPSSSKNNVLQMLNSPVSKSLESIETLSALEIAEQMAYIDHQIFSAITCQEFLGQAWMKCDKATRAPYIILLSKRFNDVSRLVASEILRRSSIVDRVAAIEKWTAVADISRCLHNYNGVLQICAAFTNTAVYRLEKTWAKVSKTAKQTLSRLQKIVSSDNRFRALRDALHRCDPPCIPYLGLYLTDLSFIEEGTPNFTHDGLLNFSKMRMIAHVIRDIRHFQQTSYNIVLIQKVADYLVDTSLLLDDDELYRISLQLEPKASRLSQATLGPLPSCKI